jgi:CRP-like cAMP-binding protein
MSVVFTTESRIMKEFLPLLKRCPLFAGINEKDLPGLFDCLSARKRAYGKNSTIFMADEQIRSLGIVVSGNVHIVQDDFWGNRRIVAQLGPGGLFGEAFICAGVKRLPVSVIAVEKSAVLFMDYHKIVTVCSSACAFHSAMVKNMLTILAEKNMTLVKKIEHITRRNTREKIRSYLSSEALRAGRSEFNIPFNRQELADYLSVDRSALSNELGKMRDAGMIRFKGNHFEIFGETC